MKLGDISVGYLLALREAIQRSGLDPAKFAPPRIFLGISEPLNMA